MATSRQAIATGPTGPVYINETSTRQVVAAGPVYVNETAVTVVVAPDVFGNMPRIIQM